MAKTTEDNVERILPTGGCLTCGYKVCQQTSRGLRNSYYLHRKLTGHDNFWQRKFAPVKVVDHAAFGMPTFKCKTEGCSFVTRARCRKPLARAMRLHYARTGHEAIEKISGAEVRGSVGEEEFSMGKAETETGPSFQTNDANLG